MNRKGASMNNGGGQSYGPSPLRFQKLTGFDILPVRVWDFMDGRDICSYPL